MGFLSNFSLSLSLSFFFLFFLAKFCCPVKNYRSLLNANDESRSNKKYQESRIRRWSVFVYPSLSKRTLRPSFFWSPPLCRLLFEMQRGKRFRSVPGSSDPRDLWSGVKIEISLKFLIDQDRDEILLNFIFVLRVPRSCSNDFWNLIQNSLSSLENLHWEIYTEFQLWQYAFLIDVSLLSSIWKLFSSLSMFPYNNNNCSTSNDITW